MDSNLLHQQLGQRVPFISVICWRNQYQQYVETLLGPTHLRIYNDSLSRAILYPGTVHTPKTNQAFIQKPSAAAVERDAKERRNNDDDSQQTRSSSPFSSESKGCIVHDFQCTVWPLFHDDETRDQQIVLLSDIAVVFVSSDNTKNMQLYLHNRIIPLLMVATSRSGVEPETSPLHCVLIDEGDSASSAAEAAGDDDDVDDYCFAKFCDKANSQQRKLHILFSSCGFNELVQTARRSGLTPMELVLDLCKKRHEDCLLKRKQTELAATEVVGSAESFSDSRSSSEQQSKFQVQGDRAKETHFSATTKAAEELRTFTILGTESQQPSLHTFSVVVQCHQHSTSRFYIDDSFNTKQKIFVTAARCPQEAVCEVVSVKPLFVNNNNNNNKNKNNIPTHLEVDNSRAHPTSMLVMTLRSRSPGVLAAFSAIPTVVAPPSAASTDTNHLSHDIKLRGLFSAGSVWGRCFDLDSASSITKTFRRENIENFQADHGYDHANNSNSDGKHEKLSIPDVVGFRFLSHFPSTPQIIIIRVPKLHVRFCRGIGGVIFLYGFGGENRQAEILAIASANEKRLMEVAGSGVVGSCIYYVCQLSELSPLYVFERPWNRVLMTAGNGIRGADEHLTVCPCEVLFTWKRFETVQKMMRNLSAATRQSPSSGDAFLSFEDEFETLQDHDAITEKICAKIVGPAANGFLSSEAFTLPIAAAEDSSPEQRIAKYLFSFPTGLPGNSDSIKTLGKACVRALVNDLFGDVHHLLVDPEAMAYASTTNSTANWLYVRQLQRSQHLLRGAVCLGHFVMFADEKIRERWALAKAAKDGFAPSVVDLLKIKRLRMNLGISISSHKSTSKSGQRSQQLSSNGVQNEDDDDDNDNNKSNHNNRHYRGYGDPTGFVRKFVTRLKLLPYSMYCAAATSAMTSIGCFKLNPLRVSLTVIPGSTQPRNPLVELALVGWNTANSIPLVESWALNLVACVSCRWQLDVALSIAVFPPISSSIDDFQYKHAEQMLPVMFLANGMDGPAALFLGRAYQINTEETRMNRKQRIFADFSINTFLVQLLRYSTVARVSAMFGKLNAASTSISASAARNVDDAIFDLASQSQTSATEKLSLTSLLSTSVKSLTASVSAGYNLIARCDGQGVTNIPGSSPQHQLRSLSEVLVFELVSDPRTITSRIPLHFLWKIAKWSQS